MASRSESALAGLWATQTGMVLHATATCCVHTGERYPRLRVRDHHNPSYFTIPPFRLCPTAQKARSGKVA